MIFDQATVAQMRAAQILGGATMVTFLAASRFRRHQWKIRLVITCVYIACVLGFLVYALF
jgi:hypothetical protein